MELEVLKNIGLSEGEIKVYQALLESGEQSANKIILASGLKKGDAYNKINDLVHRGFIEEFTKAKKKHFRLTDPRNLETHLHDQINAISMTQREIGAIMPSILSVYNLTYHKPGVQFFEGKEAIIRPQEDVLGATTEVLQVIDSEKLNHFFPKETAHYTRARIKKGVRKKILMPDTPENRQHLANDRNQEYFNLTEVRFIPRDNPVFQTSFLIYDNKISYSTFSEDNVIAIIIEDKNIAITNRGLFDFIWQQALLP